jgi:hypothetical protein
MRPAGLIPSFSLIGLRSPAIDRLRSMARAALPFPLGLRLAPQPHEAAVDACLSPARGLQAPDSFFQDAWLRPPPRRSVSISTVECTLHPHHSRIDSSARFACPPFRADLRAGFPCALGHPWLVTPCPRQWGPGVFPKLATFRHRGGKRTPLETFVESTSCAQLVQMSWILKEFCIQRIPGAESNHRDAGSCRPPDEPRGQIRGRLVNRYRFVIQRLRRHQAAALPQASALHDNKYIGITTTHVSRHIQTGGQLNEN